VWCENHLYFKKHISENHTFSLSMNHFGDLTSEEFNSLYKGLTFDYSSHILKSQSKPNISTEEESFDVPLKANRCCYSFKEPGYRLKYRDSCGDLRVYTLSFFLPHQKVNGAHAGLFQQLELPKEQTS